MVQQNAKRRRSQQERGRDGGTGREGPHRAKAKPPGWKGGRAGIQMEPPAWSGEGLR
jgi:hypothetical protein